MKKSLLILLAGAFSTSLSAQVFSSNLQNWSAGTPNETPDGWMGSRSSIINDSVFHVTGGTYSDGMAQLKNGSTSHKRFTTQPVSVNLDEAYEIRVYAKGQGNMRMGLHNGTGYQTYYNSAGVASAYDAVNSGTPVEYIYNLVSQGTSTAAEFIISVQSTVGPDHIMIDSVVINAMGSQAPPSLSIATIQNTSLGTGDSPYKDSLVATGGIVSALAPKGYWIQDASAAWSGIYCYDTVTQPAIGDSLTMRAKVVEFNNLTELSFLNNIVKVSSGNNTYAPLIISTIAANDEQYEGVLVRVENAVNVQNLTGGPFNADDGSGIVKVSDFLYMYPLPAQNAVFTYIIGVMDYAFSSRQLLPRFASDMLLQGASLDESALGMVNIYPNAVNSTFAVSNASGAELQLLNLNGQVLKTVQVKAINQTVDVNELAAGSYVVRLSKDGQVRHFNVIKQ